MLCRSWLSDIYRESMNFVRAETLVQEITADGKAWALGRHGVTTYNV